MMVLSGIFSFFLLLSSSSVFAETTECQWFDKIRRNKPVILVSGHCKLEDLSASEHIVIEGRNATILNTMYVLPSSRLTIDGQDTENVYLSSDEKSYAAIIAEGSELIIKDAYISSMDFQRKSPDENLQDGRSFIRVDAFIDDNGTPLNGYLDVENSVISHLGFNSIVQDGDFSAYGLSLKVRKEEELGTVEVNGRIRNSTLRHNYRGYYSYGARDIIFENNHVHDNHDYGVDPHDDSDGFIARGNIIVNNGGTGLALSRRCDNSIVSGNYISGNANNGILIHDLSNSVIVEGNHIDNNGLDGLVIHDSNEVTIRDNIISRNRNGIRIFAGSTIVDVVNNEIYDNRRSSIFFLHGNLGALSDLQDYSVGTDWNAQNISRHTDSRVRMINVKDNYFHSDAIIEAIEAEFVEFTGNTYSGDVTFDIRDSQFVKLDGSQAAGQVFYRLRAEKYTTVDYQLHPKAGSELSVLGGDNIILIGDVASIPADNQNFSLHFNGGEQILISTSQVNRNIQSGVLKLAPFHVAKGNMTLSSYIGDFLAGGEARVELVSPNWEELSLTISSDFCSIIKMDIEDRFLAAPINESFYIQPNTEFGFGNILMGSRGRVVMDMTCIR